MSEIRQHFVKKHYSETELWRSKKTQTFFSSCTGNTYSAAPWLSAEKLWEDLFSHREGNGLLSRSLIHPVPFSRGFHLTPSVCMCVKQECRSHGNQGHTGTDSYGCTECLCTIVDVWVYTTHIFACVVSICLLILYFFCFTSTHVLSSFYILYVCYIIMLSVFRRREQRESIHSVFPLLFKDMIQTFVIMATAQFKKLVIFS